MEISALMPTETPLWNGSNEWAQSLFTVKRNGWDDDESDEDDDEDWEEDEEEEE